MRENQSFWPSYSDLMTSLFFIVLMLFVLSFLSYRGNIVKLKETEDSLKVLVSSYQKVQNLEKTLTKIDTNYFIFNSKYKRFELKQNYIFPPGSDVISENAKDSLIKAGKALSDWVKAIEKDSLQYVLIIEGRIAKRWIYGNKFIEELPPQNALDLSIKRSLAIKNLWDSKGIKFDPKSCDLIIAGNGYWGSDRREKEDYNKNVIIHILPKVGKLEK